MGVSLGLPGIVLYFLVTFHFETCSLEDRLGKGPYLVGKGIGQEKPDIEHGLDRGECPLDNVGNAQIVKEELEANDGTFVLGFEHDEVGRIVGLEGVELQFYLSCTMFCYQICCQNYLLIFEEGIYILVTKKPINQITS